MEERKSYQLYMLEGEVEKVQFEYDCQYRSGERIANRMDQFIFSIKLGVVYLFLVAVVFFLVPLILEVAGVPFALFYLVEPFFLFGSIILLILALGAFYKGKFGMSYFKMKRQKQECEEKLLLVSQRLNKLLLQKEQLEEELAQEEGTDTQVHEFDISGRWEKRVQSDDLQCRIEMLQYKKEREQKEQKAAFLELQDVMKEEESVQQKKKKYSFWILIGVIGEIIGTVLWTSSDLLYFNIGKVLIVLLTMLVLLPSIFLWLSNYMYTFFGKDLWFNRALFPKMHDYSFPKRKERLQKEMQEHKQRITELEKEQERLQQELKTTRKDFEFH